MRTIRRKGVTKEPSERNYYWDLREARPPRRPGHTQAVGRYEKKKEKEKKQVWSWIPHAFLDAILADDPRFTTAAQISLVRGLRVIRDYESPKIRPRGLGIRR